MDSVSRRADRFYAARAADAADLLARTDEFGELFRAANRRMRELLDTLTEEQERMFDEQDGKFNALEDMTDRAIYKAGFLDGLAVGSTMAAQE